MAGAAVTLGADATRVVGKIREEGKIHEGVVPILGGAAGEAREAVAAGAMSGGGQNGQ